MGHYADRYIRRSTRHLLCEQRLERAAELRTHLLERTNKLVLEGFAPEEAEYLAVENMGGLPRLIMLKPEVLLPAIGLTLIALFAYVYSAEAFPLSSLNYPEPLSYSSAYQAEADPATSNLVFDNQALEVRLPEAAKSVSLKAVSPGQSSEVITLPAKFQKTGLFHKAKFMTVSYLLNPADNSFDLYAASAFQQETISVARLGETTGGFFFDPNAYLMKMTPEALPSVPLDRWTPIAVFNAKSQDLDPAATIVYAFASSSARAPYNNSGPDSDLAEILKRNQALKRDTVLSFRRPE